MPKCKYCLEQINKEDKYILIEKDSKGNDKKINLHINCVEEYKELIKYKNNELHWFNEVYEQLMDLLGYSSNQKLPKSLITRIQDLRNGTIMKKGVGRVVKSKDGYKYEIIFDCLLSSGDNIRWCMKNKTFKNENSRINYLMAIVEANINDSYVLYNEREIMKEINNSNQIIDEEIKMEKIINKKEEKIIPIIKKEKVGISRFLDEDDF